MLTVESPCSLSSPYLFPRCWVSLVSWEWGCSFSLLDLSEAPAVVCFLPIAVTNAMAKSNVGGKMLVGLQVPALYWEKSTRNPRQEPRGGICIRDCGGTLCVDFLSMTYSVWFLTSLSTPCPGMRLPIVGWAFLHKPSTRWSTDWSDGGICSFGVPYSLRTPNSVKCTHTHTVTNKTFFRHLQSLCLSEDSHLCSVSRGQRLPYAIFLMHFGNHQPPVFPIGSLLAHTATTSHLWLEAQAIQSGSSFL